ncbi:hypothetical protein AB0K53_14345 [Streptomyces tuirus]|uniref:hypothetical protein n=1 Tax=Streptomyces tuirus TaxID=68278 RepID=UPI003426C8C0
MASPEEFSRLVARHREDDSPALMILAGLTRMLDAEAHKVLEDDLQSMAKPWEVFDARDNIGDQIPDDPGLYMFVWRPGPRHRVTTPGGTFEEGTFPYILYIGQAGGTQRNGSNDSSNTLRKRFKDYKRHLNGDAENLWTRQEPRRRAGRLSHFLPLGPLEFWCSSMEDRARISGLEKRLIRLYNPPLNDQHRPRIRAKFGKTRNAWGS